MIAGRQWASAIAVYILDDLPKEGFPAGLTMVAGSGESGRMSEWQNLSSAIFLLPSSFFPQHPSVKSPTLFRSLSSFLLHSRNSLSKSVPSWVEQARLSRY